MVLPEKSLILVPFLWLSMIHCLSYSPWRRPGGNRSGARFDKGRDEAVGPVPMGRRAIRVSSSTGIVRVVLFWV